MLNAAGDPVGPYVCKANDSSAYSCCGTLNRCAATTCCAHSPFGGEVCVKECTNDSTCGAAHCISYPALTVSMCSSSPVKACGP
jgi:hypothetical protein